MRAGPARLVFSYRETPGAIDPRTVAVEQAVAMIEAETGRLARDQRIAVTWALEWLIDEVPPRRY